VSPARPKRPPADERPGGVKDPRLPAAVALLGHTGADEVQVRYCDEEKPVIWMAAARWGKRWETAAAMAPALAVFRLCDEVIDGGRCTHCRKPTGFTPDFDQMPLAPFVCWYQWDPERAEFRRGCAGDAP
jgi:hypothetical protein